MSIEQTIQKAIEGGYKLSGENSAYYFEGIKDKPFVNIDSVLLDPLFWQALGKSLKWNVNIDDDYGWCDESELIEKRNPRWFADCKKHHNYMPYRSEEVVYWHKFIDHLSDGGTIESYFEQL